MSGRYDLPTGEISKFKKFFAKLFLGYKEDKPFTCDVFFVNTVNDVSVEWGTPSRILVKDPVYNELVNVGANGSVKVKISDPIRFVVSVNGRMGGYTLDRLAATVRSEVITVLKTHVAETIVKNGVSLLEINARLLDLSLSVERKLNERLAVFGVQALNMNINDISIDADSKSRLLERQSKINSRSDIVLDSRAQTDAEYERTVRMASAKAQEREIQGYSYQEEQYWTTQKTLAENNGALNRFGIPPIGFPNMGYPQFNNMISTCPQCGSAIQSGSIFCAACGARVQPVQQTQQAQHVHQYSQSAQSRNCPICGYPMMPRSSKCPNCDHDTEE